MARALLDFNCQCGGFVRCAPRIARPEGKGRQACEWQTQMYPAAAGSVGYAFVSRGFRLFPRLRNLRGR
jgi:hypothetical protein